MERIQFLKMFASIPLITAGLKLKAFESISNGFSNSRKTPLIFIGHGHPMNALLDNNFTQTLTKLGESLEKPNAIMIVSAHWQTKGTFVSTNQTPKAMHDFGGMDVLRQIKYEPKGHPEFARQAVEAAPIFVLPSQKPLMPSHSYNFNPQRS